MLQNSTIDSATNNIQDLTQSTDQQVTQNTAEVTKEYGLQWIQNESFAVATAAVFVCLIVTIVLILLTTTISGISGRLNSITAEIKKLKETDLEFLKQTFNNTADQLKTIISQFTQTTLSSASTEHARVETILTKKVDDINLLTQKLIDSKDEAMKGAGERESRIIKAITDNHNYTMESNAQIASHLAATTSKVAADLASYNASTLVELGELGKDIAKTLTVLNILVKKQLNGDTDNVK